MEKYHRAAVVLYQEKCRRAAVLLTIKVMVMEVVMTGKYDLEVMVTVTKVHQKTLSWLILQSSLLLVYPGWNVSLVVNTLCV